MPLPKIKFRNMPLPLEISWIYDFLFEDSWNWGSYILKKHPGIKKVYSLKNKGAKLEFIKKYILDSKGSHNKIINKNKKKYLKAWSEVEGSYFSLLEDILNIKWPKHRPQIKAMMSINPICPRFLNDWSFSIFYDYKKISHALEVVMHECCHFLYFEKWKEIFPESRGETFESPHIEWHLSEIIAPIILNDFRVQEILRQEAVFYPEHSRIKIKGKDAPRYFTDLYIRAMENGETFDDFLKDAYKEIKKYQNLFLEI